MVGRPSSSRRVRSARRVVALTAAAASVATALMLASARPPDSVAAKNAPVPERDVATDPVDAAVTDRIQKTLAAHGLNREQVSLDIRRADTGARVSDHNASRSRLPASTMKTITGFNALTVFGPDHRFRTVVRAPTSGRSLILVGTGDPGITDHALRKLARATVRSLPRHLQAANRVRVNFAAQEMDRFTRPRGWPVHYVPSNVSATSALQVLNARSRNPAATTADRFARHLQQAGVRAIPGNSVLATGAEVASIRGRAVAHHVQDMMLRSDNDLAESLFKSTSHKVAGRSDWVTARSVAVDLLRESGVRVAGARLRDGSGLSRGNRLRAETLTDVLYRIYGSGMTEAHPLAQEGMFPLAGRTGTLANRFSTRKSQCARGRVTGKTGTLFDTISLSGTIDHVSGQRYIYAVLVNPLPRGTYQPQVRQRIDNVVAAASGCSPSRRAGNGTESLAKAGERVARKS